MEQVKLILNGSLLWRVLMAICDWFGRQWERSRIVHWFLNPVGWVPEASESSVFFKIWNLIRKVLCRIYEVLHLEKLFRNTVFGFTWFWCVLPVLLAPLLDFFKPSIMVLCLAVIGYAAVFLALIRNRERTLFWAPINRYIILYAVVYLAATFFSINRRASLEPGILTVSFILFAVVLENGITERRQLERFMALMVLVGAIVSAYGICQYLFGWGYQSAAWIDNDMFSSISFRVPSTLQNPNMLGQYLILLIPVGGAGLLSSKDWKNRIYYLCCCGLMLVCMILTFSRGAWLGLLIAGAAFFVLLNPRLLILAPIALVVLYFVLPETIITRFTSIGDMTDRSTSYRVYIWMGVLDMLKKYWLCGIGPGEDAFNMVYPVYSYSGIVAPHSHNLFLQILCDAGICALVVFLILIFVYFRMMCVSISRETDSRSRLFQIAFTVGIGGFLVQAMTDYSFYNYRVMFLFWAYLAIGALWANRSKLSEGRAL